MTTGKLGLLGEIHDIKLSEIDVSDDNVRHHDPTKDLQELADSIRRHGLLQPVVLKGQYGNPPYELIGGQRRFLAHQKILKWPKIRAVFAGKLTQNQAVVRSLVENLQRVQLSYEDTARAVTFLYEQLGDDRKVHEETGLSLRKIRDFILIKAQATKPMKLALKQNKVRPADVKRAIQAAQGNLAKAEELVELIIKHKPTTHQKARLTQHPLVHSRVSREPVSGKGRFQSLDLRNIKTLYPAYGQDRGSFVATYRKENDLGINWLKALSEAEAESLVSKEVSGNLKELFERFQTSYAGAIAGFAEDGLSCDALFKQAEDYGALLEAVVLLAKGDRNRTRLLRPLMEIGTIGVDGGRVTAIVTPWQPLRLAAMAAKSLQVSSLLRHLLSADEVLFGDPPLFFKQLQDELAHPYYPEVVLGWQTTKPELLSLTDYHLDYSLHEAPVVSNDGYDDTNESPAETSSLIVDLTKRYLDLYPHERANLSVVLYNCDSARLPYALVDRMTTAHEVPCLHCKYHSVQKSCSNRC